VPFNESWGVQHLAADPRQRDLVRAAYHLTKSFDGSRPVISNDGWEHTLSDLLTVHDYENDATRLRDAYGDPDVVGRSLDGIAPSGRRALVGTAEERAATRRAPVILSEFGGVSIAALESGTWGYRHVESARALEEHLVSLLAAVRGSTSLAGWCYTQLTDTAQETNGLVDELRVPKLPPSRIRALVEGSRLVEVEVPSVPAAANGVRGTPVTRHLSPDEPPPRLVTSSEPEVRPAGMTEIVAARSTEILGVALEALPPNGLSPDDEAPVTIR
jgi:hypothetical protein